MPEAVLKAQLHQSNTRRFVRPADRLQLMQMSTGDDSVLLHSPQCKLNFLLTPREKQYIDLPLWRHC